MGEHVGLLIRAFARPVEDEFSLVLLAPLRCLFFFCAQCKVEKISIKWRRLILLSSVHLSPCDEKLSQKWTLRNRALMNADNCVVETEETGEFELGACETSSSVSGRVHRLRCFVSQNAYNLARV